MSSKIFILLTVISNVLALHCTFHFQRASLDFDKEFINVDYDFSIYQNSSTVPKNPVDNFPQLKILMLKKVTNLAIDMKVFMNRTSELLMDQKFSFCNSKSNRGSLLKTAVQVSFEFAKIPMKCTREKGEQVVSKKFRVRDIVLSKLFKFCNQQVTTIIARLVEDDKVQHEVVKLVMEAKIVRVPKK